jgi:hypothetical protein
VTVAVVTVAGSVTVAVVTVAGSVTVVVTEVAVEVVEVVEVAVVQVAAVATKRSGFQRPNLEDLLKTNTSTLSSRSTLTLFPLKKLKSLRSSLPKTKLSSPMRL